MRWTETERERPVLVRFGYADGAFGHRRVATTEHASLAAVLVVRHDRHVGDRCAAVAEQHVAQIAKELTGSASEIAELNRGPKHQIDTSKLRALGMTFGGEALLRQTICQLVEAHRGSWP